MTKVLIVNQHGDNRGDEAALRGLADGLDRRLPDLELTVIHQFSDPASEVELGVQTTYLPIIQPAIAALRFAIAAVLCGLRLPADRIAAPVGRAKIQAFREAEFVVSAPGGPYFGDLYADHELVHWFYVLLAKMFGKQIMLYSPSCGPFENRLLNPIRRIGFKGFDIIAVREERSAAHLKDRFGITATVTADSALQDGRPPASSPIERRQGERRIAVSVRPPGDARDRPHDDAVEAALRHLAARARTQFIFLPQLHGPRHADRPYLVQLAERAGVTGNSVVLDEHLDSNAHRDTIASSDLVIAGRYHPLIFSIAAAVPVLVIPYEHKAEGAAKAAGIDHRIVSLDDIDAATMIAALDDLLANTDEDRTTLAANGPILCEASGRSSDLAATLSRSTETALVES